MKKSKINTNQILIRSIRIDREIDYNSNYPSTKPLDLETKCLESNNSKLVGRVGCTYEDPTMTYNDINFTLNSEEVRKIQEIVKNAFENLKIKI